MKPDELKKDICLRKEMRIFKHNIHEYLELFLEITLLNQVDFYKYNYEYDVYDFGSSISLDDPTEIKDKINEEDGYHIILKTNKIILGKLVFATKLESSRMLKTILKYINNKLLLEHNIIKKITSDDPNLNIFIVSNNGSDSFAKNLEHDVNFLFNANIVYTNKLKTIINQVEKKSSKNIILYNVGDFEIIKKDEELLKSLNDYIIVFGPNEHQMSLFCGNLKIQHYVAIDEYTKDQLRELILATKNTILNKFKTKNDIVTVSGISGGIGSTTISMNMANILAKELPSQNVLFIDLSHTKAVSNLFLEQNPLPDKTIIDLVNSDEFDLETNLDNGLVKVRDNFYAINGIQKHLDKEYLEKEIFVEKFLEYLAKANEYFNTIIIDAGVFESSNLKTTVYDISNEIALITEMNLPHISKLKTLYALMKRAGLKDKISFILNRHNAKSSLSLHDVISILNMTEDDKMFFNYKISNDYITLGKCWEQCELASETDEKSPFVKELKYFLTDKGILKGTKRQEEKKSLFSFFRK